MTTIRAGGVKGPSSVTDSRPALFDGTTGKLLKEHTATLGTAAAKNTGTSGDAVPLLNAINTWPNQIMSALALTTGGMGNTITESSAVHYLGDAYNSVATRGVALLGRRYRGSAGSEESLDSGDTIVKVSARGYGATAVSSTDRGVFGFFAAEDWTDSAQGTNFLIQTTTATTTTLTTRITIGSGVQVGSPTGGDKGAGTLNATAVYDDNTLLTDIVQEAVETGDVDATKWDATVPDLVEPERREDVPVMVTRRRPVERIIEVRDRQDRLVRTSRIEWIDVREEDFDIEPVYDASGNIIGAKETPITEEVVTPARTIKRKHYAAHLLKAMCAEGFKPGDYKNVCEWWGLTKTLPGMPSASEWEQGKYSLGEMTTRAWMTKEIIMAAFTNLVAKVEDHERRLAALES